MKQKQNGSENPSSKMMNKDLHDDLLKLCEKYHKILNPGEFGYECIRFMVGMLRDLENKKDLATTTILAALLDEYEYKQGNDDETI